MSTAHQSLSHHQAHEMPNAEPYKFGIVVAEWNQVITEAMAQGAIRFLLDAGAKQENISRMNVPGSFELTAGASMMAQENYDAVICIGCVIQGETRHFDFICDAVAKGITNLNLKYNKPFIFGVLTVNTQEQAEDRTGGKLGNKGDEAAVTAIKMLGLKNSFELGKGKIGF